MDRITEVREVIGGLQVDITFYGGSCMLSEMDRSAIYADIKKGKRSGKIGSGQAGREGNVMILWKVPFECVNVGDTVEFSTSGKYNPGFSSTETYIGRVEYKTSCGEYCVKSDGRIAVVPLKHIERVIKKNLEENKNEKGEGFDAKESGKDVVAKRV